MCCPFLICTAFPCFPLNSFLFFSVEALPHLAIWTCMLFYFSLLVFERSSCSQEAEPGYLVSSFVLAIHVRHDAGDRDVDIVALASTFSIYPYPSLPHNPTKFPTSFHVRESKDPRPFDPLQAPLFRSGTVYTKRMRKMYERGRETLTNPSLGNRSLGRLLFTQDLALRLAALALLGFGESVVRAALLGGLGLSSKRIWSAFSSGSNGCCGFGGF